LTSKSLCSLISKTNFALEIVDFTNLNQKEFTNEILKAIGNCSNLKKINLSGCSTIGVEGISNIASGDKDPQGNFIRKEEIFRFLKEIRLNSIGCDSDGALLKLIQITPNLEILDLNNFSSLNETTLNMICRICSELKII